MIKKKVLNVLIVLTLIGAVSLSGWECGKAPPTKRPQRRKAGEGFPPLPLPVTPLRRTEKKNPPSPPVLVGKVICGPNDKWTRAGNDVENLLKIVSKQLGIHYRAIKVNLNSFSFDPEEIPILYITSVEPYIPGKKIKKKLKEYLERGGFIWANASSGSPEFTKNFVSLMSEIFPERNLYPLYSNHPLKNCFYPLENLTILDNGKKKKAPLNLRILNIGCRAAVILSPYDLGCGWAMHTHPWGVRYIPEDAVKIGINMTVYSLGWIEFGKLYGLTPLYVEKVKKKSGKLYIGQIIHSGDWNPHPSAIGKLLKTFSEKTDTLVYLEPINVDLKKDSLENVPILYITGHYPPRFSEGELKKLREFLVSGGCLIADSCCGSKDFTEAFHKIMEKVLPEAKRVIPDKNYSIYQFPYKIEEFIYNFPNKNVPPLEIYFLNDLPVVVFSPYGLGSGWEGIPRPYTRDISITQASKLGTNILVYLMTH